MGSDDAPIHSRFDDDPAHAEAIDGFVVALAERVDELQDLESHGQLVRLAEHVTRLGNTAQAVGYPLLARSAEDVAQAARQGDADLVYKALLALTDVARRVRRGHRGAL